MTKTSSEAKIAIVIHIHYVDTLDLILRAIKRSALKNCDIYFTLTADAKANNAAQTIESTLQNAVIDSFENKGRDILPFLRAVKKYDLTEKYSAILKLHGKRTVALPGYGAFWLIDSLQKLIPTNDSQIRDVLSMIEHCGVIGPAGQLFDYSPETDKNHKFAEEVMAIRNIAFDEKYSNYFFGGSMLWFNSATLELFTKMDKLESLFPEEGGQLDGTVAHAIERLFTILPANVYKQQPIVMDASQGLLREYNSFDISIDGLIRAYEEFTNRAVVVDSQGGIYTLDYPELKDLQENRIRDKIDPSSAIGSVDVPENLHTILARTQEELSRIKSSKKYKLLEKSAALKAKIRVPISRKKK